MIQVIVDDVRWTTMSVVFFVTAELTVLTGALAALVWKRTQQASLRPIAVRSRR